MRNNELGGIRVDAIMQLLLSLMLGVSIPALIVMSHENSQLYLSKPKEEPINLSPNTLEYQTKSAIRKVEGTIINMRFKKTNIIEAKTGEHDKCILDIITTKDGTYSMNDCNIVQAIFARNILSKPENKVILTIRKDVTFEGKEKFVPIKIELKSINAN
jgi:hypothetical protein